MPKSKLKRKNGVCNWFVREELKCALYQPTGFILHARPVPLREVLLSPLVHIPNKDLILQDSFWSAVLQVRDALIGSNGNGDIFPIEGIALNFGALKGRIQNSEDHRKLECDSLEQKRVLGYEREHFSASLEYLTATVDELTKNVDIMYKMLSDFIKSRSVNIDWY